MKKIFIFAAMVALATTAFAQEDSAKVRKPLWPEEKPDTLTIKAPGEQPAQWRHNLQIGAGLGVHALLHHTIDAKTNPYVGGTLDIQYQYMFTPNWGIGAGIGFSSLGSVDHMQPYSFTQTGLTHPDNMLKYDGTVNMKSLRELQTAHMFNIPVEAVYYHPLNAKWAMQARMGLTLNVLLCSKYKTQMDYSVSGYFPSTGGTYNDLPLHGLTSYTDKANGHNDLRRVNLSAQAEVGALYALTERTALYCGLYANYGMVNMAKHATASAKLQDYYGYTGEGPLMTLPTYMNTDRGDVIGGEYFGVMQSDRLKGDIHPFEFGVKVGVRLGLKDRMPVYRDKKCPKCPEPEPCPECPKCPKCPEPKPCPKATPCPEPEPCPACPEVEAREEQQRLLEEILSAATYETAKFTPIFDENADAMFESLKNGMDQYPDNIIIVTGHTDNVGGDEYNMHLGMQRAEAFKAALVEHGINEDRIVCESKGKTRPIADNDTEEGRAKNRRVALNMR